MARILLVNESSQMRQLVSGLLKDVPGLEQVVTAGNGELALRQLARQSFDLVLLDFEIGKPGGLELLDTLKRKHARLPVVMLSRQAVPGGDKTVQALMRGAADYLALPQKPPLDRDEQTKLKRELIALLKWIKPATGPMIPAKPAFVAPESLRPQRHLDVLAIGASTGGPKILEELLAQLPADLSVPVLIVQHIAANFVSDFAHSLGRKCSLPVSVARHEQPLRPGEVLLAAGERHLQIRRRQSQVLALLDEGPLENSCRPSVDVLFRSVAEVYGSGALAVVLTGMGNDGLAGARMVRQQGGHVLVQDQASSVVWGMPGAIAQAGLADAVLSPAELAREILLRIQSAGQGFGREA